MRIPLIAIDTSINAPGFQGALPGQGLQEFGQELQRTSAVIADVEDKKRRIKEDNDAFVALISAKKKAIYLQDSLSTITDNEEYMNQWNEGWKGISTEALAGIKSPNVTKLVERGLGQIQIQEYGEAKRYSNNLFISDQQGKTYTALGMLKDIAETTTDPNQLLTLSEFGNTIISENESVGTFKKDDAAKLKIVHQDAIEKAGKTAVERLAKSEITAGTFKPENYSQLDADTLMKLTNIWETKERQKVADKDREEKRIEKNTKDRQENNAYNLSIEISKGKYVFDEVLNQAETREIDRTQFEHLRDLPSKLAAVGNPNDEPMIREHGADIHSVHPTTTIKQVQTWIQNNSISGKLGMQWIDRLRETANVNRNEGKGDIRNRHSQAEQEGKANLTTTSPFEKLDPVAQDLQNNYMAELRRRSAAYDGTEDPLKVADEIIPKYKKLLQDRQMMSSQEMMKLLRYPTPQALEDAYKSKAISKGEYESQKRLFIDLSKAQMIETETKSKTTGQRK